MKLYMARGLQLPPDAVTQTFGFLGRKGSGKTHNAGKLVEELLSVGAPVIVLDPVGNWWGLRLDASGKRPGFPIPVIGGQHGDLPLQLEWARMLGRLASARGMSAVIDVSEFRKAERKRFVTDFAEELFHQAKSTMQPIMVVYEEAQVFAPQRVQKGEERMLGAIEDNVRLGRNYGIGSILISQRPQSVNKEVLNQVECLFVGQMTGPHERKAIEGWIVTKGAGSLSESYVDKLPSLKQGEMFVWSPQWLEKFGKFQIDRKKTFDASATPKLGERRIGSKLAAAPVDLEELRRAVAKELEGAKSEDPKLPKKRALEFATRPSMGNEEHRKQQQRIADLEAALEETRQLLVSVEKLVTDAEVMIKSARAARKDWAIVKMRKRPRASLPQEPGAKQHAPHQTTHGKLGKVEKLILTALAQHQHQSVSQKRLALLVGYHARSKGFTNGLGALRGRGAVDSLAITEQGLRELGAFEPLPTGPELIDWYCERKLRAPEAKILRAIQRSRGALDREQLANEVEYHPRSKGFTNSLGRLRGLGLVEGLDLSKELKENT